MLTDRRAAVDGCSFRFRDPSRNPCVSTYAILILLGLTTWLGCDAVVEPELGPAVEVQVTPPGMRLQCWAEHWTRVCRGPVRGCSSYCSAL